MQIILKLTSIAILQPSFLPLLSLRLCLHLRLLLPSPFFSFFSFFFRDLPISFLPCRQAALLAAPESRGLLITFGREIRPRESVNEMRFGNWGDLVWEWSKIKMESRQDKEQVVCKKKGFYHFYFNISKIALSKSLCKFVGAVIREDNSEGMMALWRTVSALKAITDGLFN